MPFWQRHVHIAQLTRAVAGRLCVTISQSNRPLIGEDLVSRERWGFEEVIVQQQPNLSALAPWFFQYSYHHDSCGRIRYAIHEANCIEAARKGPFCAGPAALWGLSGS